MSRPTSAGGVDNEIRLYSLRVENLFGALLPKNVNQYGDANVFCSIRYGDDRDIPTAVTNMALLDENGNGSFDVSGFSKSGGSQWAWNSKETVPSLHFTFWSFVAENNDPLLSQMMKWGSNVPTPPTSGRGTPVGSQRTSSAQNTPRQQHHKKRFCGCATVQLFPSMLQDGDLEFKGEVTARNEKEKEQEFSLCETMGKVLFTIKAVPSGRATSLLSARRSSSRPNPHPQPPATAATSRSNHHQRQPSADSFQLDDDESNTNTNDGTFNLSSSSRTTNTNKQQQQQQQQHPNRSAIVVPPLQTLPPRLANPTHHHSEEDKHNNSTSKVDRLEKTAQPNNNNNDDDVDLDDKLSQQAVSSRDAAVTLEEKKNPEIVRPNKG